MPAVPGADKRLIIRTAGIFRKPCPDFHEQE